MKIKPIKYIAVLIVVTALFLSIGVSDVLTRELKRPEILSMKMYFLAQFHVYQSSYILYLW